MQHKDTTETNAKRNSTKIKTKCGCNSHHILRTYKR